MDDHTLALRLAHLVRLPRIGSSVPDSREALQCRLEDLAMSLGDLLEARQKAADPYWWHVQDVLDDALDCLEAVRGERLPPAQSVPMPEPLPLPPEALEHRVRVRQWACERERAWQQASLVHRDLHICAGAPVFRGTHIPVDSVARRLAAGDSHEAVLAAHPALTFAHLTQAQLLDRTGVLRCIAGGLPGPWALFAQPSTTAGERG